MPLTRCWHSFWPKMPKVRGVVWDWSQVICSFTWQPTNLFSLKLIKWALRIYSDWISNWWNCSLYQWNALKLKRDSLEGSVCSGYKRAEKFQISSEKSSDLLQVGRVVNQWTLHACSLSLSLWFFHCSFGWLCFWSNTIHAYSLNPLMLNLKIISSYLIITHQVTRLKGPIPCTLFPKALQVKVWSMGRTYSIFWELVRNANSQVPPKPADWESAFSQDPKWLTCTRSSSGHCIKITQVILFTVHLPDSFPLGSLPSAHGVPCFDPPFRGSILDTM